MKVNTITGMKAIEHAPTEIRKPRTARARLLLEISPISKVDSNGKEGGFTQGPNRSNAEGGSNRLQTPKMRLAD